MSKTIRKISSKGRKQVISDEQTYEVVWNSKVHACEECGRYLGDDFRDSSGKIAKFMFSHILTKAAYPEFRSNPKNFNLLCFKCHQKWEFGDRTSMNINEKNEATILLFKSGVLNTKVATALFDIQQKAKNNFSVHWCKKILDSISDVLDDAEFGCLVDMLGKLENEFTVVHVNLVCSTVDSLIMKYKDRGLYE
jgi:5-methylcytosine-specific restriction endonuclease McrA